MPKSILMVLVGLALAAQNAFAMCQNNELSFLWPLEGADGSEWVINNYVDLDPSAGILDYKDNTGTAAKTYDGHNGVDIDVSTFRDADFGAKVRAAASGVVTEVQEDLFDRQMQALPGCGPWNHVYIQHPNGMITWYGHLRFGYALVVVGDQVTAGQVIGLVGSSGCSTQAHLHFEVRSCDNQPVDPFQQGMFANPPLYDPPFKLMDLILSQGGFPDPATVTPRDALLKDPQPNIFVIPPGGRLGIGLSLAGGQPSDTMDVRVLRPNNALYTQFPVTTLTNTLRHWYWRGQVSFPAPMDVGGWRVEIRLNNILVNSKLIRPQLNNDAVILANHDETYQQTFQSLADDSYIPVWIDGSGAPEGGAVISAIYRRGRGTFQTVHNLDGAQYQAAFDKAVAAGLQLVNIDNYIRDGQPRIAAVFGIPITDGWVAYHLVSPEVHQQRFNELTAQGYRPYAISVAVANGQTYISAAYTITKSRGWAAYYDLTEAQYQAEFDRQLALGRAPVYIDAYQDGTIPKFSAIWTAEGNDSPWGARHGLTEEGFHNTNDIHGFNDGWRARVITSYLSNGARRFAGVWRAGP